jgi:hypothetical protein
MYVLESSKRSKVIYLEMAFDLKNTISKRK